MQDGREFSILAGFTNSFENTDTDSRRRQPRPGQRRLIGAFIRLAFLYPSRYNGLGMNTLIRTAEFAAWLEKLRDLKGKARILSRLDAAALGNFGDCEPWRK